MKKFHIPQYSSAERNSMGFFLNHQFAWVSWLGITWILFLTISGWGCWGTGVMGDYSLDLADALRLFQGDIPYRDFLATYGPLNILLVAPFFTFGKYTLSVLWFATAGMIIVQLLMILRVTSRKLSFFWFLALSILYVSTVAFAPTNARFIMGYSQSGFLSSFLWVLLLLTASADLSLKRWFAMGICLGIQPFTKMDMGITAVAVLIGISTIKYRCPKEMITLGAGFFFIWSFFWLALMILGADPRLILGGALEALGQASLIRDETLGNRFLLLALLGFLIILGLCIPRLRVIVLRLKRFQAWMVWILPCAIALDLFRNSKEGYHKNLVFFNYCFALIWIIIVAHLIAAALRQRSWRFLSQSRWIPLLIMLMVSGVGLFRIAITGWYPLNYYQPILLVLGILWFSARPILEKLWLRRAFLTCLVLGLVLQSALAYRGQVDYLYPLSQVETPFGMIGVSMDDKSRSDLSSILKILKSATNSESILCTYEPTLQVLSGKKSAAFYTYFHHLGFGAAYQQERDTQSLELFHRRAPKFIIQEKERAIFSKHFGSDFGRDILDEIQRKYEIIFQADPANPFQITVWQKKT